MKSAVRLGLREQGFWLPPERPRLWLGLAIAVVGPIALTPVIRTELFSELPGVPYLFAVVLATVIGRMLAAGVATLSSVALIDRYFLGDPSPFVLRSGSHLVAIAIFVLVAVIVAQLLVRLDRVTRASADELDRLALLARAGDALSGPLDVEVALSHLGDVLVPALADWCSVALVDESGDIANVLVVHPDPDKVALARELQRRFPADRNAPSGAPNVIRTGISELTERITDEMLRALVTDEELLGAIRPLGLRCAMVVPLSARGRTLGALTLVGAESHDRYTESDLRLAEEIGDRAGLAIDTARLFEAESRARAEALAAAHRNAVLTDVTAAFGRAPTVDAVLAAMLDEGIRRVGAAAGTVGLVADGARVELVGTTGYEKDDHPYWHSFGLDEQLPMAEAIRERSEVVVTTTAERDRRYPALRGRGEQRDHALVCVPLLLGEEAIGAFSASYPPGTPFGQGDLGFLRALGEQCAQAIDRARSVERERTTRARFNALAVASRTLARTLDPEETAASVVRLATDHLGGRAALYEPGGGTPARVATASTAGAGAAAPHAWSTSEPGIVAALERAVDERAPQLLEPEDPDADARPGVVLPLGIAGSVSNALLVLDPLRDFRSADELEFAREIARRMARALENARLYRERDYVARTLQRSLLPISLPEVPGLDVRALFRPAVRSHEVGGDFYDVFQTSDGRFAAVIGDVCGKGVEAATLTGLARHTLRALADVRAPSDALRVLNAALLRESLDGRFITVAYVLIQPRPDGGARLQIASGGHPLPQRVLPGGQIERVGRHGTLLGVAPDPTLVDVEMTFGPGETLVLFTDGLLKRAEASADVPAGLVRSLKGGPIASADDALGRIKGYVDEISAGGQDDDIAVLVLRAR